MICVANFFVMVQIVDNFTFFLSCEEWVQLLLEINENEDSLRIYRIVEPLEKNREQIGKSQATDFESTLIV